MKMKKIIIVLFLIFLIELTPVSAEWNQKTFIILDTAIEIQGIPKRRLGNPNWQLYFTNETSFRVKGDWFDNSDPSLYVYCKWLEAEDLNFSSYLQITTTDPIGKLTTQEFEIGFTNKTIKLRTLGEHAIQLERWSYKEYEYQPVNITQFIEVELKYSLTYDVWEQESSMTSDKTTTNSQESKSNQTSPLNPVLVPFALLSLVIFLSRKKN